jgi:hypothetical protein
MPRVASAAGLAAADRALKHGRPDAANASTKDHPVDALAGDVTE